MEKRQRRTRRGRPNKDVVTVEEVALPEAKEEHEEQLPAAESEPVEPQQRAKSRKDRVAEAPLEVDFWGNLMQQIRDGARVVIERDGATWSVVSEETHVENTMVEGKLPRGFWDKLLSEEFKIWKAAWDLKGYEEKIRYAKDLGAKWEPVDPKEHNAYQTEMMRVSPAVRAIEGIEKFLPDYRTRAQRVTAKRNAKLGLSY